MEIGAAAALTQGGFYFLTISGDVMYVTKRIIAPIYLLDAFVELMLFVWWLFAIAKF